MNKIVLSFVVLLCCVKVGLCDKNNFKELCSNDEGALWVDNENNSFLTEDDGTAFFSHQHAFKFRCRQNQGNSSLTIGSEQSPVNQSKFTIDDITSERTFKFYFMANNKKGLHKEDIVECSNVCKIKLIVFNPESPTDQNVCTSNGTVKCNVDLFSPVKNPTTFLPNILIQPRISSTNISGEGETTHDAKIPEPFNKAVSYYIFDPINPNREWIKCKEYQDEIKKEKVAGISHEEEIKSIDCPIEIITDKERPVIIRIRREIHNKKCVALPYLCEENDRNIEDSFVPAKVKGDGNLEISDPNDPPISQENVDLTIFAIIFGTLVFLLVIMTLIIYVYVRKYRKSKEKQPKSTFYVNDSNKEKIRAGSPDTISWKTETTNLSNFPLRNFTADDFDDLSIGDDESLKFNDDSEEGVKIRKQIISRQLSGDPTKINPELPLNQQAKVLSYNPKFEIDFSNFKIGKLLGSGNFGSVFEGTANGLFHPGSINKVAIKTVNDSLNRAQLGALLCEIKILTSLDLNLNLVNLLGSCTSNLHNGDLYALLEFCPHGNLKDFLINHRADFYSSVINNIAVNNLDDRLFLKWAHSIAKGMEYLYNKKIMHGDLAARNILIGGLEGDNDNYVAKVSDFGLSKNFYDNYRYKKQNRDVPWKWMAFEYLKDGSFTMKSDVWSYGVVIWELLSLGQEPYAGKSFEDSIIKEFKEGYRLSCPQELRQLPWLENFYSKVTDGCWQLDTSNRYSFTDLVHILEEYLTQVELKQHEDLNEQYKTMRALMTSDETRLKRVSTLPTINQGNSTSYTKVGAVIPDTSDKTVDPGYIAATVLSTSPKTNENIPDGYITMNMATSNNNSTAPSPEVGSYITVTQAMS